MSTRQVMKGFLKFIIVIGILVGAFFGVKTFFPEIYDQVYGFFHECEDCELYIILEPTCEIDGKMVEKCTKCSKETGYYEILEKYGHNLGEWKVAVEPLCSKEGLRYKECLTCQKRVKEEKIEKTEHVLGNWIVESEPTCTLSGYKYKVCENCNEKVEQEEIAALGHNVSVWKTEKEMTCNTDGLMYTDCSRCQERLEEKVIKAEHQIKKVSAKAATCTESGYTSYSYCEVCKEEIEPKVIIKAKGHNVITVSSKAATCTEDGYTESKKCSDCAYIAQAAQKIQATGHGDFSYIKGYEATCTKTGLTDGIKCGRCKKFTTPQNTISKLAHTIKTISEGKEATCFQAGYTAHTECTSCNQTISKKENIAQKSHNFDSKNYCSNCGLKVYISAADFKYDCSVSSSTLNYNGSYKKIEFALGTEVNEYTIIFPTSVDYVKINGSTSKTYKNITIQFKGTQNKYLVLSDVIIETAGSIIKADGGLYLYAIGNKNSLKCTGAGATGAEGAMGMLQNGKDGGTGGNGSSCIVTPACMVYTKSTEFYVQGQKGGTGGKGGIPSGIFWSDGRGGAGGTGGNAFAGTLVVNAVDANDLYSHNYSGVGTYKFEAGAGGAGGSGRSKGSTGAAGYVASNYKQSGLQG